MYNDKEKYVDKGDRYGNFRKRLCENQSFS